MKIKWKKLITKFTVWIVAEVLLNSMGLDTLADYSEFFFEHQGYRDSSLQFVSDQRCTNDFRIFLT
jgi:hypothetical protein